MGGGGEYSLVGQGLSLTDQDDAVDGGGEETHQPHHRDAQRDDRAIRSAVAAGFATVTWTTCECVCVCVCVGGWVGGCGWVYVWVCGCCEGACTLLKIVSLKVFKPIQTKSLILYTQKQQMRCGYQNFKLSFYKLICLLHKQSRD